MKKQNIVALFLGATFLLTSCATIVSKSKYPVSISSNPDKANISITNKKGTEVYRGTTPATVELKPSAGFFTKAEYQLKFEKAGYDTKIIPIHSKINGWYLGGNLFFGGLIGWLIVDPATGAMYKLDTKAVNETLTKTTANIDNEIKILDINTIPEEWKNHLIAIQ